MSTITTLVPVSLADLARLVAKTVEVFGSADQASAWLETTNPALGGRTPINVYQKTGSAPVEELLQAIEYGTLS